MDEECRARPWVNSLDHTSIIKSFYVYIRNLLTKRFHNTSQVLPGYTIQVDLEEKEAGLLGRSKIFLRPASGLET